VRKSSVNTQCNVVLIIIPAACSDQQLKRRAQFFIKENVLRRSFIDKVLPKAAASGLNRKSSVYQFSMAAGWNYLESQLSC
jgi:hypothetical protein